MVGVGGDMGVEKRYGIAVMRFALSDTKYMNRDRQYVI